MRLYPRLLDYGVAVSSTASALLLSLWLEPLISRTIGAFFYIAIIISTWYGGFRPGIVTVILSTLAINYLFIPPRYQFWIEQPEKFLRLGVFLLVALTINIITSNLLHSRQKIKQLNQKLLQENAEQLRMALSAAQMGMWDWNIGTGELKWSPEQEQLFGLTVGTFDGKYETFAAYLHPDERFSLNQAVQQALQTHSIYQHEYRIIWADGSIHWLEGRGQAFYNEAGQPVRMTGTVIAIDERKQAQGKLEQQFEQQRLVMEMTQRIRRSLNLQDILQNTVDEVRQFLGCDRVTIFQFSPGWGGTVVVESVASEWMAILPLQIYDPCIGEENVEPFKQGLVTAKSDIYTAGISPCHIEFLASLQVRANLVVPVFLGDELWGLLAAHQCAGPREWQSREIELLGQLGAQVSIAIQQAALFEQVQTKLMERKQAEKSLQESEATLRLFAQYAPAGIAMFDRDMRYLIASQRWVDDHHLDSVESLIGRSHYEIFPEITERWRQIHQRCLAGASEKCDEDLFVRLDGTQQWICWEIHPWHTAIGKIGGIIIFGDDITQRKQVQIALQQLNAELEQRVAERTVQLTKTNDRLIETVIQQQQTQVILLEQAQLLDLAHDTIITRDLNGTISFWNEGAEYMYGWTKAEAFGQIYYILLKTEFPQPIAEIEAELLDKGYWEGELIHFSRDARPITVASRWALQKDNAGIPIKILEINNDITERKQVEAALQHYVHEVEDLYNNAPCGYHSLDGDGNFIRINDTELNWLGYTRDEIFHKKFLDVTTSEGKQVFQENFPKFKQQGWVNNLELKIVSKDGTIRWVSLNGTAIKDETGNFVMSRSTLFDITERKQAEFALINSEESRRLALDLTHTAFWDLHLPSKDIVWNDNHFTLLGLVPYSIEPSYEVWRNAIHPEDVGWVEQKFLESIENRTDYTTEYRVIYSDGSVHWLMGRARAIYDESGQPLRSLGVLLDISERKRIEAVMRQYERIVSSTKDGIALLNRNYIYQIVNQAYLDWCNKPDTEVLGHSVRNVLGENLFDNFIQSRLDRCLAGETIQDEKWFDYPNLVPQFLSVTYTPYRELDETISGVIVSLRDLTRLKQAEQMLELQAVITRNMAEGICLVRADNAVIVYANPKFEQMFGYDSGELNGQHVSIVNYENESVTAEDVNQAIRSAVLQKGESTYEVHNVKKDGTPFWCSATTSVFRHPDYGDVLVAVQQDITERKRIKDALRQSEEKFRQLAENIQAVFWMTDIHNLQVLYVSKAYEAIWQRSCENLYHNYSNWLDAIHPEDRSRVEFELVEQLKTSQYDKKYRIIRPDGSIRWIRDRAFPIKNEVGEIVRIAGIAEDITEQQQIEQIKSEFIGIVSHELRTPLTAIRAAMGLLQTGIYDKKPDKFKRMIEIAAIDSDRLVRLVNDILNLERLESGRAALEKTTCQAADLIEQAVAGLQAIAKQQNITFNIHPTNAQVWADADGIIQTLTNLLGNALKFSSTNSTITLNVQQQADYVLFQIIDRGRGIPAEKLEAIFGRFQQVDASDSRTKGGTGLGLAICRSIIEQHGGQIWAQSTVGVGSTFFFTLPIPRN
ncbi:MULTISPECIES: PAS domain S-box protein [Nostoc]|uniref:histidine kinase n=2 Tax=Nostoc TaxID=1177 RepID=A0ABR8ILA8_9NOSO|nr:MULTISPECIES: PAS domain S-box protein [Nostoc]MBD2564956.1 PAS domain S-box protein [Nostoc linckia FACHB-391]MBD2651468.1 PAS domain S-box protein [Nostoc foliaceum FACHB-393]